MTLSKVTGVFAVSFMLTAGATTAYADSSCKDVTFTVKNMHSLERPILITKVEYWDFTDKKWRTEDVAPNKECKYNHSKCITSTENLEYVENEVIKKFRFHYKEWVGEKWSADIISSEKKPLDQTTVCHKGRNYGPGDGFIIP